MKLPVSELKSKIIELFAAARAISEVDRKSVADYMVWSEMSGVHDQGIVKLAGANGLQKTIPEGAIKIERETPVSMLIDGAKNIGIVVADKMTDIAIEKAKKSGLAIVASHNTFSSNGAQAYYVEKIAAQDLIGIMCSRSPGTVAPFGSIDPLFGTNPVGYAFPTDTDPIVFDGATSARTFYSLILSNAAGETLPEGIATDKHGNPTTSPADVMDGGALCSFGGHKASGFSMLVELLTGPLAGGSFLDYTDEGKEWGTTIIAINPEILVDLKKFKSDCSKFVEVIRASRTREGRSIRMPHDNARKAYKAATASGMVEIDNKLFAKVFNG
ncbi:MAG: Ldh family oxidoreductase [Alphaproteobacteria bacterium]|nr:Ldh family oxidoreductase [Alphaproteobacteria bacterium]